MKRGMNAICRTLRGTASAAALIIVCACGSESPSAPLPAPSPTPTPTAPFPPPAPPPSPVTRYHVSGIVTDESGSLLANAQVAVQYDTWHGWIRTSTNDAGYYDIAFEDNVQSRAGVGSALALVHGDDDGHEHQVQALPWGATEIVKNLRLRRSRTITAGQSITVPIEPDSSLVWDNEDWLDLTRVWERVHIRVPEAGTLNIEARPEAGGVVPSVAVLCIDLRDNCRFDWVKAPAGSGTASLKVQADSLFELLVVIRTPAAPQRYVVSTSLQKD